MVSDNLSGQHEFQEAEQHINQAMPIMIVGSEFLLNASEQKYAKDTVVQHQANTAKDSTVSNIVKVRGDAASINGCLSCVFNQRLQIPTQEMRSRVCKPTRT